MKVGWRANCLLMPSVGLVLLASTAIAIAGPMDELAAAAKAEGQLTVIGLPRDWCGYGGIIDGFKAKYGLTVNELMPDTGSAKVIDVIKASRDVADPQTPDVIDVGPSYAASAKREGLLLPYKMTTWADIPHGAKDAGGSWSGADYGTLAFAVNADIVKNIPADWADLASPHYRNAIGLAGDLASNQAIQSVFAAGLSAANGNVRLAADQGLKFFADLHRVGNFVPIVGDTATLADGRTPILIRWDYLAFGDREQLKGKTRIEVVRPKTGRVAGVYVQAISAFAQHPNAARLWMEYLYSDETQIAFLNARCHPMRLSEMLRSGKIPVELNKTLVQFHDYGGGINPLFPTLEEQEKAKEIITKGWDGIVGAQIQCLREDSPSDVPMAFNDGAVGQCPIPQ